MSINDLVDDLESAALSALAQAGAIKGCPIHSDVTIRPGKADVERRAYAIATIALRHDGTMWLREDLMRAIKSALDMAADGECPQCAHLRVRQEPLLAVSLARSHRPANGS